MPQLTSFLNEAAESLGCCVVTALSPVRSIYKKVDASLRDIEILADAHRQQSLSQAQHQAEQTRNQLRLFNMFVFYKNHLAASSNPDDKFAYYFLCSVESLPEPHKAQWIMTSTMGLESDWANTKSWMSEVMRRVNKSAMQNLPGGSILAVGN